MVVGLPAPLQLVANSSLLIGILSLQILLSKVTDCLSLDQPVNLVHRRLRRTTTLASQLRAVGPTFRSHPAPYNRPRLIPLDPLLRPLPRRAIDIVDQTGLGPRFRVTTLNPERSALFIGIVHSHLGNILTIALPSYRERSPERSAQTHN